MRTLCIALSFVLPVQAAETTRLPAQFEHDRVVVAPTLGGRRVLFYTDTGGGWNAIAPDAVARLGVPRMVEHVDGERTELIAFPAFDKDAWIPDAPAHMGNRLFVASKPSSVHPEADGFLGGRWFADRVWEIDYPRATLRVVDGATPVGSVHRVPLGFQVDATGRRSTHFPRMPVTIDGETLDVLLDTGATATLTDASAPAFGVAPGTSVGTSFIEHAVFERWRARHPHWRVIDGADDKGGRQPRRMIEVPAVTIAGHTVGPVWFAEQPDGAFQRMMAQWMDRPTWGALGGSALRYFRVVIDYPNAVAYFHRDFQ
jgi:hypothetical protein